MNDFVHTSGPVPGDAAAVIAEIAASGHVADAVEALNRKPRELVLRILAQAPLEQAVELLDQPELHDAPELVAALPQARAVELLGAMAEDRAADVLRDIDDATRLLLLHAMEPGSRRPLAAILGYPEGSAGSIMTTEYVSVPPDWTVARTLDHIRQVERSRETVYAIYVVEPDSHQLLRAFGLRQLIANEPETRIGDIMPERPPVTVPALMDVEHVAHTIRKYDLLAVPVVEDGRIVGIVTVDDVIDTMIEETTEDVHRLGGMEALDEPYMKISFLSMIGKRGGWLCALFLSEMLTASVMQHYEVELERAIVLTLFIPLIMSSGGNSGSQATSLVIRAMALRELTLADWWRVALRELPSGLVLGVMLGVVGVTRIVLWQYLGLYDYGPYWHLIAATVGLALVGIVTFGSLTGSMLPFALRRLGFDPASASAPFVATLVDVTGLFIYFSVAVLVLRGTLL